MIPFLIVLVIALIITIVGAIKTIHNKVSQQALTPVTFSGMDTTEYTTEYKWVPAKNYLPGDLFWARRPEGEELN